MKVKVLLIFWLVLFLVGCVATADPYTGLPTSITITEAQLYAGPGNTGFEVTATLPEGEIVDLMGIYGDFVQVHIPSRQGVGFLWKDMLEDIPMNLPTLTINDVPWIEENYITDNCLGPFTTVDGNTAVIHDYAPGPGGYQLEGAPIQLGSQTQLRIEMRTDNGKAAWISLADLPFRNYGEWYLGYRRITIFKDLAGFFDGYSIEFRDGLKPDAITIPLPAVGDNPFLLVFNDASGRTVQIQDLTGNVLYEFIMPGINYQGTPLSLPDGFFPKQIAYLSCASDGPTNVTFIEPNMTRAPIGIWEDPWQSPPSLRELAAEHGIKILVPGEGWRFGNERYSSVVQQSASMFFLFGDGPTFWLGRDRYNFDYMDPLIENILQNGQEIMMGIVYGPAPETLPEDIRNGKYTQDEYRDILHDYVTSMVCRYRDQVSVWSIGNESVGARAINYPDFWAEKVGPDYVDLAFQWARECDPDGILLLNDSINDSRRDPDTTLYVNAMLAEIQGMKARGIPIDAVGIQGHFFLPWNSMVPPTKDGVMQTMQEYADLGVSVYITELDVNLTRVPGDQGERWAYQAEIYRLMMDACLESGVCRGFGVWGINDSYCFGMCFSEDACPPNPLPEPLWFDDNFNPKPAFYAILESLMEH